MRKASTTDADLLEPTKQFTRTLPWLWKMFWFNFQSWMSWFQVLTCKHLSTHSPASSKTSSIFSPGISWEIFSWNMKIIHNLENSFQNLTFRHSCLYSILCWSSLLVSGLTLSSDHNIGYQTSNSVSSLKFHHFALLALLMALVSCSSNFHHWHLLALLLALVLH